MNEADQIVQELIESDAEDLGTWKDLVPEPQAVQDLAKLKKYRPYIHHNYDHYYAPFVVPVWTPTGRLAKSKCWHGWYRMEGFTYNNPPTWEQEVEAVGKLFPNRLPGFHPSRLQGLVRRGYRIGKPYDPYRQRFYESIDEALNPELCAKCKGKCCLFYPGITSPEDWGAPDQDAMRERIIQAVNSGKYEFDSWYGDPTGGDGEEDVWMVRPASERQPLTGNIETHGYERCKMLGKAGCDLEYQKRPRQCRELDPQEGGKCQDAYSKKAAAIDWMPYQPMLRGVLYGTNESEEEIVEGILHPNPEDVDRLANEALRRLRVAKDQKPKTEEELRELLKVQDTPDFGVDLDSWWRARYFNKTQGIQVFLAKEVAFKWNLNVPEAVALILDRVKALLSHESIHHEQWKRHQGREPRPSTKHLSDKERRLKYLNDRSEIMAWAYDLVQDMRGSGYNREAIFKWLHRGPIQHRRAHGEVQLTPENEKLFRKYLYLYAQQLPESEEEFDAKDLTPLSAQEIELAAATEIADRLHQAGLKFVVKGDLATRAAAWPDLFKLVTLGKDAQFVLDQRLKNATTGQDYVRFWTIIPYTPDYGDYYTTWQWHLQDTVGKEHKLWLHNRGLVEVNIDVGESTQKEMVERLMVAIQEAKPVDRERLEKVYNKLYGQAADALSKRKPCAIDASTGRVTCLGSREGIYGNPTSAAKYGSGAEMDTLCCTGCTHHTPQGCAAEKPLACKTWLCPHAAVKNPELAKRLRDLQSRAMKAKVYEPRGDMPTAISRGLRSWQWAKEEPRVLRLDYEEPGGVDTWTDQEKWAEAERLFGPEPQDDAAYQDWLDRVEEWWYSGLGESRLQVIEGVGRVIGPIQEVRLVRWAATKHVPTGKIGRDFTHWDATEQLLKQGVIPGINSLRDLDGMEDQNQATAFLQQLEDGYILDDGRFVSRDEGEQVAREMGQLQGAETEKVEREAIDASDINMDMDIEEAQGTPEPDYDAVARYAHAWFKKNARNFNDWPYEIGFALYWSPQGKVVPGTLVQGEAAEVEWPEQPELGIEVGSIHSHTGCSAELSDFDAEEGQKVANRTGQFYAMFVIGPDDEGEGVTMVEEVFEPENVNESVDDECDWKELVPDHLGHIKFMCPFTKVEVEGQPYVKHYFSDEVGDWIEEFDKASIFHIDDYAKNGVIDLEDCPMGTEAIINVTPDGQFLQEIPLDDACGWKIVDSHADPLEEAEGEDFDIKDVTGEPVAYKVRYMCRRGRTYGYYWLTLTASTEEEALMRFQNWDWPDARARRVVSVEPVYSFHESADEDFDMKDVAPDPRIFTLHWHGFDGQWYHTKPLPSLERALKLAFEWSLFTIKGDEAYIEEQHPEDPYNFITRHHLNDNYEVSNEEEGSSGRWFGVGEEPPLDETRQIVSALIEADEDFDVKELTTPEDVLPIFQFTFEDDTREHGPRIEQVPVPWAVLQRHAGDWATLNKKDAAYMPLDDPCDYALPYVRKLHPDWPWGQLNDIRLVNKVEESEDDFDMKELTPESRKPVGFQLTFDFGAGEDGYSIQVFVPPEEFDPRFQTRDQIAAQWDEDMSMIEDTVIEYAQRTRTDIDRDDWSFMVQVDLLPAEERQRGHMILVQNGDDPLVRCSVCGHEGNLMSDFSYLKAGFNGIQPGGADDLDLQECGACGAYLAWSNIRNVNESADEDFDAKELDLPVINPDLIVDEMKANGWPVASCVLSHPDENVWMLEWNSPLELTHDMPEDEYNREADRAEAAGMAAIQKLYPQATNFEFYAPFSDGDFGLYFHIPGEYHPTRTGYTRESATRKKLFDGAVVKHPHFGKLTVRVTHRDNVIGHPELWQAIGEDGKPACPDAYSEQALHRTLKWYWRYKPYYDFVNENGASVEKPKRETRTYKVTSRPDHLDQIEHLFHWINTTRGGHSGSAMLGIDGDGAARVEVEKKDGDLAKPDEEIKSRCDGKAEFEVYLESRQCECQGCGHKFDYASVPEASMGAVHCPACASVVDQTGRLLEDEEDFDTKEVSNVELPQVPAYALADDADAHGVQDRVDFNAVGWFLRADLDQIRKLAHCGWCRDYPADDVARDLAQDNHELAEFFERINGGFEVYVNQEAAEAFLKQFRSDVYDQLRAEHEILE